MCFWIPMRMMSSQERERERETKKCCCEDMIVSEMPHAVCHSGAVVVKSRISLGHNVINNTGRLATGNTYISNRKGPPTSPRVCGAVTSPNSMTATVRNDSLHPVKVIIRHWSVLCPPPKAAFFFFFNREFSQVSSTSPLLRRLLLLQSSEPAVGIPPQYRSPNKVMVAPCSQQPVL